MALVILFEQRNASEIYLGLNLFDYIYVFGLYNSVKSNKHIYRDIYMYTHFYDFVNNSSMM